MKRFKWLLVLFSVAFVFGSMTLAANTDKPDGFKPAGGYEYFSPHKWSAATSQTIAIGDAVALNSSGLIQIFSTTTASSVCGVAATYITSNTTASQEIWVYDNPHQVFEGQCSGNGKLADPITTAISTDCFDIEGATGIMEINEDATTYDLVRVIGIGRDPATGDESAQGANQRKVFRFNPNKHQLADFE